MVSAAAVPAAAAAVPLVDAELMLLEGPAAREANLLELQVSELLSEVRFDASGKEVHSAFKKLRKVLLGLPEESSPSEPVPGPLGTISAKSELTFRPPDRVELAECSATAGFPACPEPLLDVLVTMPGRCFLRKDHLEHRYHAKRAQYLAHLASELGKKPGWKRLRWECLHDDPRKPVLLVTPKPKAVPNAAAISFRIIAVIEPGTFPVTKFAPHANNIRCVCETAGSGENGGEEAKFLPTPFYNNSMVQDVHPASTAAAVTTAAQTMPAFKDAMLLLQVWLRQHGLEGSSDDLGMGVITAFAAHLVETAAINSEMNVIQAFKAVLKSLAAPKLLSNGCCMTREEGSVAKTPPPPLAAFKAAFEVCLIDPSGWVNLAAHASKSALLQASAAAKRTLAVLDSMASADSAFQAVFLPRHRPTSSHDHFWRVELAAKQDEENLLRCDRIPWRQQEAAVAVLCRQAFDDRVSGVRVFGRRVKAEASLASPLLHDNCLLIAARANPEAATRLVDVGPSADSPKAKKFREFWGNKSEIRRFQDGRICEAVAWEAGPAARHLVLDQILKYVFERHMPESRVEAFSGVLDWAVEHHTASADSLVMTWRDVDAALVRLGKQLRSLDSLALKIVAVQPLGAAARHTTLRGPLQHPALISKKAPKGSKTMRCVEPVELLVQLEGSGRWIEQPEAFRKMKAALGVQLAEELLNGFGLRAEASETCTDVFSDGFAFRLFLSSERDVVLARRVPQLAAEVLPRQRQAAHHGRISQIAAAHPSFRAAARLAFRWVSAHLLSNQIRPEAVELLVAAAYCPGNALGSPGSPLAGFLGFLRTVARQPWDERPLFVDPDASIDAAQMQGATAAFLKAREEGTAPGLPIVTPTDPASAHWTAARPPKKLVMRIVALAARDLGLLEEAMFRGTAPAAAVTAAVFDPGLADFDAVILLRRDALPNADWALRVPLPQKEASRQLEHALSRAGFPGDPELLARPPKAARAVLRNIPEGIVAEWGSERIAKELLVGFDPVEHFVGLLEERFGHLGMFCTDFDGGQLIAIKWDQAAFQPRAFTPETAHTSMLLELRSKESGSSRPAKKRRLSGTGNRSAMIVPHLPRVIHEIREMGAGLVLDVRLKCSTDL